MRPEPVNFRASSAREEGAVLLLVLLVLTLISVLALSWAQEWRSELKLVQNFSALHKSQRLAEAGIYYALGKLISAKTAEMAELRANAPQAKAAAEDLWQGDQRLHTLELPDGKVEIRIGDDGGKINLNMASEALLHDFFTALGLPEPQVRTMVDSIQDWRERGDVARPYGAKSPYYLSLEPPYVAKNSRFETVEELAWVRGFAASPLIPRLNQWLTVQATARGVNLNTAPLEVLMAMGFPRATAQAIMVTRQVTPFRTFQDIGQLNANPLLNQKFAFRTSPFFTIISTGMAKETGGRKTIKAIVRLDINKPTPWMFVSWHEGFPG
jgi:general secretion pathway protein K